MGTTRVIDKCDTANGRDGTSPNEKGGACCEETEARKDTNAHDDGGIGFGYWNGV